MKAKRAKKMKNSVQRPRVVVAMSGGVDSSVAAALLQRAGYEVIGVFMKFWKETPKRGRTKNLCNYENKCCSAEAQADARRVAAKLKIPLYTVNAEKEFKKRVVDYFIREYAAGRTPNPCVECNHYIKFGLLVDKTRAFGTDFLATGHYAKISKNSKRKTQKLLIAKDKNKDQSYFLYTLTQAKLKKIIFPIGNYRKPEVRQLAKKFGLPIFEKRDSQEICFIATDLYGFLKARIKAGAGPIITVNGKKIGEHRGLAYYTIGQRKGLSIGGTGPYYVVKKDFKKNTLIVANPLAKGQGKDLLQKEMIVKNVNWISAKPDNGKCQVKIRSLAKMAEATIKGNKIVFNKPQRAIASGQSAVFYSKDELLGGGIIR